LNAVLCRANRLTELHIHGAVLSTCDDDFISMGHLSALKTIDFTWVYLSEQNQSDDFHALIAMCVSAPHLQTLHLSLGKVPRLNKGLLLGNTLDLLAQTKLSKLLPF
jgi:hypothetical protein